MYRDALLALLPCMCVALPINASAASPLVAEFESSYLATGTDDRGVERVFAWTLERTDTEVIVQDSLQGTEERWQRDESGRIWYSRVFHDEKRVLEFSPADFKRMGPNKWEQISSVIDPAALASLRAEPKQEVLDRLTTVYRGKLNGQEIEIWWLEQERLPALVRKRDRNGTQTMRLVTLSTMQDDVLSRGRVDLSGYDILDFADIGDRHDDPLIEQLMKHEGIRTGH